MFSRDIIQRVNKEMIERKRLDMSGLPAAMAKSIKANRFTKDEINRSFSEARRQVIESAKSKS